MMRRPSLPFIVLGIAFFALGVFGQRANYLGLGAAFLAIGIVFWVREKRASGSK